MVVQKAALRAALKASPMAAKKVVQKAEPSAALMAAPKVDE